MYDRILVPTDGSAVANRAGTLAVEMAARFDAELHVIHVRPRGRAGRSEALSGTPHRVPAGSPTDDWTAYGRLEDL